MKYTQLPLPFLSLIDETEKASSSSTSISKSDKEITSIVPTNVNEVMVNLILPGWEELVADSSLITSD